LSRIVEYVAPERIAPGAQELSLPEREVLDAVNERVAAGESLDAIMSFLFESTREVCPCDRISVAFIEDEGRRVVSNWTRTLYEPVLLDEGYAADLRGSSLAAVLKTNRLRIIHDLEEYLARKPQSASTRLLVEEGVRSSMTCPLQVEGRQVGFLFRSSRETRRYNEHQAALHFTVAARLSQAVEKAWRIDQLESANRAYQEMLGFVSHELKSPLASLIMDARLMTEGYLGDMDDRQLQQVQKMVRKSEYLMNLVAEYLDLARIEEGRLEADKHRIDFRADVLEPAIDIIQAQAEEQGTRIVECVKREGVWAECDPHLLKVVMVNLLGNAVKYGIENGEVRVTAGLREGNLEVSVWNRGPGFSPEQRPRLFRKFSRLESPELKQRKGTGVGLYTCWRIIELHDGTMDARSEEGAWAEFSFRFPA
jgi:hypothetical protein